MIAATNGKDLFSLDQGKPTQQTGLKLTAAKDAGPLLCRVFQMAAQHQVKQLWALPGSSLRKKLGKLATVPDKWSGWEIRPNTPETLRKATLFTAWHPAQKVKSIQLVMPGLKGDQWKLDAVNDPELWAEVVKVFINYLRVGPSIPIRTARKLAEQVINLDWLTGPADLDPFMDCSESDLSYKEEFDRHCKVGQVKKWLHVYDKRNAYLSAAGALLGVGESIEIDKPTEFSQRPGIWHCDVFKPRVRSQWDVLTGAVESFEGWYYTPMVHYFQQRGYVVRIKRAVVYSFGHRVLEPWYQAIRQALVQIPQDQRYSEAARTIAVKCLKSCYQQFIGWLGGLNHSGNPGPFYRPDWRHTIISLANARMAYNIDRVIENTKGQNRPVGVRVDSVMWFSDEPDPMKAIPAPFDAGKVYRVKYSVPGDVAMQLLSDPAMSIQKIDDQLKAESENYK